jgi:transcriptional regulator with XRE-family HTH domain
MDTAKIQQLLKEKLRSGMSKRQIGREIGVAHTTIGRVLDGQPIASSTLEKIAEWLDAPLGELAYGEPSDASKAISVIIAQEPALGEIFSEMAERMQAGEISPETVREIIRYTAWRLQDAVRNSGSKAEETP